MKVILIRHFATKGNLEKRYVGITDEDILEASAKDYPECGVVFSSPLKRCVQTAKAIYGCSPVIHTGLSETDFGKFEYRNFEELKNDSYYKRWIESGGKLPFPDGESMEEFSVRTVRAFYECIRAAENMKEKRAAFVMHGGSIIAVLSTFTGRCFYNFHVKNGGGYICGFENGRLSITGEINV